MRLRSQLESPKTETERVINEKQSGRKEELSVHFFYGGLPAVMCPLTVPGFWPNQSDSNEMTWVTKVETPFLTFKS